MALRLLVTTVVAVSGVLLSIKAFVDRTFIDGQGLGTCRQAPCAWVLKAEAWLHM